MADQQQVADKRQSRYLVPSRSDSSCAFEISRLTGVTIFAKLCALTIQIYALKRFGLKGFLNQFDKKGRHD